MKLKIISLLFTLLAISNFSFAQYKHTHSEVFLKATKSMYGIEEDIEFQNELINKDLKTNDKLKTFTDDEVKTQNVTFGMFMDDSKYSHYVTKEDKFTTDCYTWVFEIKDFQSRCEDSNNYIGKFEINCKDNVFSLNGFKGYKACERISKLMGIDTYPEHIWLCTFAVPLNKIFRPAYQTSITSNIFEEENGKWKVSLDGLKEFDNIKIKGKNNEDIKHISPQYWLGLLQKSKEYPWTRMGYTYDWEENSTDHMGVSEFVIVPGTEVTDVKFYKEAELAK